MRMNLSRVFISNLLSLMKCIGVIDQDIIKKSKKKKRKKKKKCKKSKCSKWKGGECICRKK